MQHRASAAGDCTKLWIFVPGAALLLDFRHPVFAIASGIVAFTVAAALRRLARFEIDEGGIRFPGLFGFARRYRPFDAIAKVELAYDGSIRALDENGRKLERWWPSLPERQIVTYDRLVTGVQRRHMIFASGLDRDGRGLRDWLDDIAAAVHDLEAVGPYRSHRVDLEQAEAVVFDLGAPLEIRAGAAFALLSSRRARHQHVAAQAINESSPPLMLAASALAKGGAAYSAWAVRAADYLPERDREDLLSNLDRNTPSNQGARQAEIPT